MKKKLFFCSPVLFNLILHKQLLSNSIDYTKWSNDQCKHVFYEWQETRKKTYSKIFEFAKNVFEKIRICIRNSNNMYIRIRTNSIIRICFIIFEKRIFEYIRLHSTELTINLNLFKTKQFRKRAIRHIQTAIRHMWRVANGLDNDALNV